jgi:acyl dehydratase
MNSTETADPPLVTDVGSLPKHAGADLGHTAWRVMDQQTVTSFADLTEDHNPIHIDPDFAASTPFGGTIAHGYLTLSMVSVLLAELLQVDGASLSINYGLNKLRFPAPLPVGARYRAGAELAGVKAIEGGFELRVSLRIEVEDAPKPTLVAECLFRHYA